MNKIRTLADELRDRIRSEESSISAKSNGEVNALQRNRTELDKSIKRAGGSQRAADTGSNGEVEALIENIRNHRLKGDEKLLLRLDTSTVFLLKQLKIATGIDMTQFVSFCLHDFLERRPLLKKYVKNALNNFDL